MDECHADDSGTDIRHWDDADVQWVTDELAQRVKAAAAAAAFDVDHEFTSTSADALLHAPLSQTKSVLRSYPVCLGEDLMHLTQPRAGRPLIVISLHPQQQEFGKHLESVLMSTADYEVWLTTELLQQEMEDCEFSSQVLFESDTLSLCPSQAETQPMQFDNVSQHSSASTLSTKNCARFRQFQEKVDEAGLIIFVLSNDFAKSCFTRKQVFYCEHRKRVIPVCYEDIHMPGWMSMLIGTSVFEDARADNFEESLKKRVRSALDPSLQTSSQETNKDILSSLVTTLREQMTTTDDMFASDGSEVSESRSSLGRVVYVYISGSTMFYCAQSETICRSVGEQLAAMDQVHVVTGGFYGVGDVIGRSYHEKRSQLGRPSNIWHVLPKRDSQDYSRKCKQNADKSFAPLSYGRTLFVGESVRQREQLTARAFDVCIVVEGGPGAAHEAEQFAWNDHVVVPVKSTGGAAGGKFNVPRKIFEVPADVNPTDWSVLADSNASADDVGLAVTNVITSVRARLSLESPSVSTALDSTIPNFAASTTECVTSSDHVDDS